MRCICRVSVSLQCRPVLSLSLISLTLTLHKISLNSRLFDVSAWLDDIRDVSKVMLNSHWIPSGGTLLMFILITRLRCCLLGFCTVKLLSVFCIFLVYLSFAFCGEILWNYVNTPLLFKFLIYMFMDLWIAILLNFLESNKFIPYFPINKIQE